MTLFNKSARLPLWGGFEGLGKWLLSLMLWLVGLNVLGSSCCGLLVPLRYRASFGGYSWLTSNLVYGALIGLAAFTITQLGLTLWAIRKAVIRKGPFAEQAPENNAGEGDTLKEKGMYWENRKLLKKALVEAHEEGSSLRESKSSLSVASEWVSRTQRLIDAALGYREGEQFPLGSPIRGTDPDKTLEEQYLDKHLCRLTNLIERVDSLEPLELQSDFDGQQWVGTS